MNPSHLFLRVAFNIYKIYWRIFMPFSFGVRVIIVSNEGKLLVVRHSYKSNWYVPGGSLACCEKAAKGATREVYEETSLKITDLKLVLIEKSIEDNKNDLVAFFVCEYHGNESDVKIDGYEIIEYKWIEFNELKNININGRCLRAIDTFLNKENLLPVVNI